MKHVYLFLLISFYFFGQSQQVTLFNTSNSPIMSNRVNAIAVDAQNNKWFGTYKGLSKLNSTNIIWESFDNTNGLPANFINDLCIDAQNNLWIGTDSGATIYSNGIFQTFNVSNSGLSSNQVTNITTDANGNIWFSGSKGITKYDGTNWTIYDTLLTHFGTSEIETSNNNEIWYGSYTTQPDLTRYSTIDDSFTRFSFSQIGIPSVSDIHRDIDNNIWVVGSNAGQGGIAKFNRATLTWENFTVFNGTFPKKITSDINGDIWIGMSRDGSGDNLLYTYQNNNWIGILKDYTSVNALAIDKDNNKWIAISQNATDSGVISLNTLTEINSIPKVSLSIYPNPAKKSFDIRINEKICTVKIYDPKGLLIEEFHHPANNHISLNDMPIGIYIAEIITYTSTYVNKLVISY